MVLLGGKGTLWGPVIGAIIFHVVKETTWTYLLGWQWVALGLILIINIVYFQQGIMGWLQGLKHATGDYIGWTHADLQTDPKDVVRGFELINDENTFVKGSRRGRRFGDNIFTIGMAIFETILLKTFLWEIMFF